MGFYVTTVLLFLSLGHVNIIQVFFFLLPGKDCMEFMTRDSERHENQLEMDSLEITNKLLHFDLNNFC